MRVFAPIIIAAIAAISWPLSAAAVTTIKNLAVQEVVEADGTYTQLYHMEAIASDSMGASQMAQLALAFNPSLEKLDIIEAYTLKRDGTRKNVDAAAIKAQLPPGLASVPVFADVQQKVVIFPDLDADDTRVITYRREVVHPLFSGQFTRTFDFSRAEEWQDAQITVSAPAGYSLHTESIGVPFETHQQGDRTIYAWHYSGKALLREDYGVAAIDRRPRIFISSFPDYDAMAAAYLALAAPKERVTPIIQAKADDITKGLVDRREQARVLYDWVSRHIRYVAIYLVRGGVEPHMADAVLANGYGDCKDHVTLLAALLKAKGIDSRAVMINLGNAFTLGAAPTLGQLNHVITYVPEFDLYADSTLGVAAFGDLAPTEYGKPIVMVGSERPALRRLPMPSPDATEIRVETMATLLPDGRVEGTTRTTATGATAVALRYVGRLFRPHGDGARDMAERELASHGETGTGRFYLWDLDTLTRSASLTGSFELEAAPGLLDGDPLVPPVGLSVLARPGDFTLGPIQAISLSEDEPVPCFPAHQVEERSLALPPNRAPARLPAERRINEEEFSYFSRWSLKDNIVTVRRELTSRIDRPLCEGALRHAANEALRLIRRDQQATITLTAAAE